MGMVGVRKKAGGVRGEGSGVGRAVVRIRAERNRERVGIKVKAGSVVNQFIWKVHQGVKQLLMARFRENIRNWEATGGEWGGT